MSFRPVPPARVRVTTAVTPNPVAPAAPPTSVGRGGREQVVGQAQVVVWIGLVGAAVTIGLWIRHGGVASATGPGGVATAVGQLTALVGTYAVLVQLLLMSRIVWLERAIGLDHLAVWHRWTGFATVWLLVGHVVFTTVGYAQGDRVSLWAQTRDFISHYPDVLMAWVGFALFLAVAVTSVRARPSHSCNARRGTSCICTRTSRSRCRSRTSSRSAPTSAATAPPASGGSVSISSCSVRSSGGG